MPGRLHRYFITYWHRGETWEVTIKASSPSVAARRALEGDVTLKLDEKMTMDITRLRPEAKETTNACGDACKITYPEKGA
ncbi:hypothetical protein LCGC14_2435960 [marine sediment metagenome]|uniref:Uncharacterized protein n=1 Tax=marine sediment metagenome TaxID=412755 RepID=A0A0F9BKL5_9ZZZZ